jgi:S-adenosylmethionine:tRNA ribosyltransferase-isomerase
MINLKQYDYYLPHNLIAKKQAVPRDGSRLLVYYTGQDQIFFDRFYNLDKYLPQKSFLVLNKTKVLPARVTLRKETGGKIKVLFLVDQLVNSDSFLINALVDRKVKVGDKLLFGKDHFVTVTGQKEKIFQLRLSFNNKKLQYLLEKHGQMPIPLYIKNTQLPEQELRKKYQTIFAENPGSTAAPTASLHFTNHVFKKLETKGIKKFFITLHVGLGTFSPVTDSDIKEKKLHEEYYRITEETLRSINRSKQKRYKLVAVGTTVVRALESVVGPGLHITDLFILPTYKFKTVDILLTNFHLPKSSLIMLVDAFLKFKASKKTVLDLYQIAIKEKFRFYSFGDAMLIL